MNALFTEGGQFFNNKDYANALPRFQMALNLYPIYPEAQFFAGISASQLQRYDLASNYLLPLTGQPGQYQAKAVHLAGYSLIKQATADEQAGMTAQAEQKYNQSYQLLSSASGLRMSAEEAKNVQIQLNWLTQRKALRSDVASARPARKKSRWSWLFDPGPSSGTVLWVPGIPSHGF